MADDVDIRIGGHGCLLKVIFFQCGTAIRLRHQTLSDMLCGRAKESPHSEGWRAYGDSGSEVTTWPIAPRSDERVRFAEIGGLNEIVVETHVA